MSQAAKSRDGRQHAELWLLLHHVDVHCHHSQVLRDIVHYLLRIRGSGRPEISGEVCSEFVAQDVLKFPEKRAKMTNRVILALSISDIIFSACCNIFGTWPVTQGLVYGSSENQVTCTDQGFLIMFSVYCDALYNMTLELKYLLQVRYEWSEEKLRRYQPFFIFIPISVTRPTEIGMKMKKGWYLLRFSSLHS